jgi:hypothetical protein
MNVASGSEEPWIETREGMLFFVHALFVIPEYCVLFPLGMRTLLRASGLVSSPSVFLDTLPALANHFLPYVGWILLLPIGLILKNFTVERARWRRGALVLFLLSHVGFLSYTVRLWFG